MSNNIHEDFRRYRKVLRLVKATEHVQEALRLDNKTAAMFFRDLPKKSRTLIAQSVNVRTPSDHTWEMVCMEFDERAKEQGE